MELPKRSKAKKIGNEAALAVSEVLTRFSSVVSVPESEDMGIDLMCELLTDDGVPTGRRFNVQCKGTEVAQESGAYLTVTVKTSTARYWLIQPSPTFVVLADLSTRLFHWAYPREQLMKDRRWENQETVAIRVPRSHLIAADARQIPEGMRAFLEEQHPGDPSALIQELELYVASISVIGTAPSDPSAEQLTQLADSAAAILTAQSRVCHLVDALYNGTLRAVVEQKERTQSLLTDLDYTPGSARLWPGGGDPSVFEFGAGAAKSVWCRADQATDLFVADPSRENYERLLSALAQLVQLGRDISCTTRLIESEWP